MLKRIFIQLPGSVTFSKEFMNGQKAFDKGLDREYVFPFPMKCAQQATHTQTKFRVFDIQRDQIIVNRNQPLKRIGSDAPAGLKKRSSHPQSTPANGRRARQRLISLSQQTKRARTPARRTMTA